MREVEISPVQQSEVAQHDLEIRHGPRRAAYDLDRRTIEARELYACGVYQVVEHRASLPVWDALHRVGDVHVEAREEPEAMLAGQVESTAVRSGETAPRYRDAARLAARDLVRFQYLDVEAALDEFLRRTQSRDSATEHCHPWGHRHSMQSDQAEEDV